MRIRNLIPMAEEWGFHHAEAILRAYRNRVGTQGGWDRHFGWHPSMSPRDFLQALNDSPF